MAEFYTASQEKLFNILSLHALESTRHFPFLAVVTDVAVAVVLNYKNHWERHQRDNWYADGQNDALRENTTVYRFHEKEINREDKE